MKFLFAIAACALFVSAFAEEHEKKVDKRDIVLGSYDLDYDFGWPYFDSRFYNYYHGIYKRDTSAHSIQKRDVAEESKPKTEEKRDLLLGYGGLHYYRNYPYFTGYRRSYPYFDYYNNYGLHY